jgi:hypothetical protein
MRYARYLRLEKYIVASDTGGIVERWKYGRRLREDRTATTPRGGLKNGVLERLLGNAAARGYKLSEREIQYRLKCARAYLTEAEIRTAGAEFGDWTALRKAGFPTVEVPEQGKLYEPYDPRDTDEKVRDAKGIVERAEHERERQESGQGQLQLYFLPGITIDTYGPESSLEELFKAHECIKADVTHQLWRVAQMSERDDQEREQKLQRLLRAVGGNRAATWREASDALYGVSTLSGE